jgi:hypothetical protein
MFEATDVPGPRAVDDPARVAKGLLLMFNELAHIRTSFQLA